MDQPTVFILHLLRFDLSSMRLPRRLPPCRCAIDDSIPATTLLHGRVRARILVELRVTIIRVRLDDPVLRPAGQRVRVDPEATGQFLLRQQRV